MKLTKQLASTLRSLAMAERTWTITMVDEYHAKARKLEKLGLVEFEPRHVRRGKNRGAPSGFDVVVTPAGQRALEEAWKREAVARPGTLRIWDVGDRRVITLAGVHRDEELS